MPCDKASRNLSLAFEPVQGASLPGMLKHYLGCDLGAESGRLILGSLENGQLQLKEVHRFANTPLRADESLQWNIPQLWRELKAGLKKISAHGLPIASISCDSWGVDYLLFDSSGALIPPVFHYRDPRSAEGVKKACAKVDRETIFDESGIQFMPFNTLFQLASEAPARLSQAEFLLLIGDGFNYFLSGVIKAEESIASTSQLYNPRTKQWSERLIHALGLSRKLFPPVVPSGTRLGCLRSEIIDEIGGQEMEVIATCVHDTGAAVAAVPATGEKNWAYLSSGTWSLMGVELAEPLITDACRELNFTNELGYGGAVRLLKNIVGLWIVQECRREWSQEGQDYDYSALTQLAAAATPFVSLINPADPRFLSPGEMPSKIASFCVESGQQVPSSQGMAIRCVLESLALLYRRTLRQIEELIGRRIEYLHVVGGGCRNMLLNQFTANALQIPVLAGPAEATAAGNILVQAIALGDVSSLPAARGIIRDSLKATTIEPTDAEIWEHAYQRFEKLVSNPATELTVSSRPGIAPASQSLNPGIFQG